MDIIINAFAREIDQHIARQLKHLRCARSLSQADLAKKMGVSAQQVQKYECAANRMSGGRILLAAYALDISPLYFFAGWD